MHSITSCRIKKAFHYFGYAIIPEDDVLEIGFGFSVKTDKSTITRREAVLAKKERGLNARLVELKLDDPEPLLYHN